VACIIIAIVIRARKLGRESAPASHLSHPAGKLELPGRPCVSVVLHQLAPQFAPTREGSDFASSLEALPPLEGIGRNRDRPIMLASASRMTQLAPEEKR
jgi:hypothetical protein